MREFAEAFHRELLKADCGKEIICVDGKAERGTVLENGRNTDIVSAYSFNTGITLATEAASRNITIHRKQCDELERTVQTSEALYRTGNATYLELLTARQSLLNARLNVVADTFSRLQAVISLYKALGGGVE